MGLCRFYGLRGRHIIKEKRNVAEMNYLWGFMILVGILYASFNGTLPEVTEAAINSAKEAVSLCITMMGVVSFWTGMMRIAEKAEIGRAHV